MNSLSIIAAGKTISPNHATHPPAPFTRAQFSSYAEWDLYERYLETPESMRNKFYPKFVLNENGKITTKDFPKVSVAMGTSLRTSPLPTTDEVYNSLLAEATAAKQQNIHAYASDKLLALAPLTNENTSRYLKNANSEWIEQDFKYINAALAEKSKNKDLFIELSRLGTQIPNFEMVNSYELSDPGVKLKWAMEDYQMALAIEERNRQSNSKIRTGDRYINQLKFDINAYLNIKTENKSILAFQAELIPFRERLNAIKSTAFGVPPKYSPTGGH